MSFPLWITACEGSQRLDAPTVFDSGSVRIVEYEKLSETPVVLEEKPHLILGGTGANPEEELDPKHPFLHPTRLGNGEWVVSDRTRLVFFGSDGRFVRSAGKQGPGPGEFAQLGWVCPQPDSSLLAVDWSERRLSTWSANGSFLGASARPGFVLEDSCFPDGSLVMPVDPSPSQGIGSAFTDSMRTQGLVEYVRIAKDGAIRRSLGWHRRSEMMRADNGSIHSYLVSFLSRDRGYYVGDARDYEIRGFKPNGNLELIVRVKQFAAAGVPRAKETGVRSTIKVDAKASATEQPRTPLRPPPYLKLRSDQNGRIWVQEYRTLKTWTVFDSSGCLMGRLILDERFGERANLAAVLGDDVAIRSIDTNGFVRIGIYRVTWPPRKGDRCSDQ